MRRFGSCFLFLAASAAFTFAAVPARGGAGIEFSSYRASSATNGSLYVYIRNDGDETVRVERILVDGKDAGELYGKGKVVSWLRVRPEEIAPGGAAEALVRFESLPQDIVSKLAESFLYGEEISLPMKVLVEFDSGERAEEEVFISAETDPFQLNFIGFGENLDKLYLYLQNNRWLLEGDETPLELGRVWVNGKDLTRRSRFGSRVLEGNVVPVEVSLEEPLERGAPAVVTAEAAGGFRAGHALRAFPSEFPIQVTFFRQVRADSVRDVYNHCATAISSREEEHLLEMKERGLDIFSYGGRLNRIRQLWKPGYPRITGLWLDERDKWPVAETIDMIRESEEYYHPRGRRLPPYTLNICSAHSPRGQNYLEIGDAVTHNYGMDGGGLGGRNFAGFDSLRVREYRLSRRPFWPYMRNAETGFEVEEGTDRVIGPTPIRPYPLHPKEERWLTYGCLMQGAKGILHWGYGVMKMQPPPAFNWMSREHKALRISMGGVPGNMVYGYELPEEVLSDLRETWGEIGRINAELQTIGGVVARSDVCSRARITRVDPAEGAGFHDERSAEVATLVSGLDTMVVIVLNMNMDTRWRGGFRAREDRVKSYPPVDATVEVEMPGWLRARDFFTVTYEGLERVRPRRTGRNLLEFEFAGVEVSRVLVATSDRGLYGKMSETLSEMQSRLARIETDEPEPIPERTISLAGIIEQTAARFEGAAEYREEFDSAGSMDVWGVVSEDAGEWGLDAAKNAYIHTRTPDDPSQSQSVSAFRIADGDIVIRAAATQHNEVNNGGCFGIVAKYIDSDNWYAVRMGAYGSVNVRKRVGGATGTIRTGRGWRPEIGRFYEVRAEVRGDALRIFLDGEEIASLDGLPFAGEEGYTGVFALSSAEFERFHARRR